MKCSTTSLHAVYKSGRVERLRVFQTVQPSSDPYRNDAAVLSKDVVVSPETGVSVRIFVPVKAVRNSAKLPLLIYAHGGAFCLDSAFSSNSHNFISSLVSEANVIAVSIDYRLAPENPIPTCYVDSWVAIQWVATHHNSNGPNPWLNNHANFNQVFLSGGSAGANIIHNMIVQIGSDPCVNPLNIKGSMLIHPFFGNGELDPLWEFLCRDSVGAYDLRLNPAADPTRMAQALKVDMMLVCVASKDDLRGRGVSYYEALKESGWRGKVEVMETEGEGHSFHLFAMDSEKALALLKRLALFINGSS